MPGSFAPGFGAPGQGGPLFFPQSESDSSLPLSPDEDLYVPLALNSSTVASLFLAASFLVPWAGSYDEVVVPAPPCEEDAWLAPVLLTKPPFIQAFSDTDEAITPVLAVDEDYPYNKPIQWPATVIRLTWPGDEELVAVQGIDGDEWQPKLPQQILAGKLVQWAQDEITATIVDEEFWVPVPLVTNTTLELLVGTSAPEAPVQQFIQGDEPLWLQLPKLATPWQSVVILDSSEILPNISVEEEYWFPVPHSTVFSKLVNWDQADSLQSVLGADEEPWVKLNGISSPWQSSVVIDSNGDWVPQVPIVAEEDYWQPIPPVTATTLGLLVGTSAQSAVAPVAGTLDESVWVRLTHNAPWHPSLVSDPTDDAIPQVSVRAEEDFWLPIPPVTSTTLSLLAGTSAPAAVPTQVTPPDEHYQLQLPKLVTAWYPSILSDPTDDRLPPLSIVEDEVQLTVIVPPVVVSIVAPWDYSDESVALIVNEDEITFSSLQLSRWTYPRIIAAWRVGENEPLITALRVQDEEWIPFGVPQTKLSGQRQFLSDLGEIASLAAPIINEDYHWFTYCITKAGLVRYDQWKSELNDVTIFVPPPPPPAPKCTTELPGGVTITVESPVISSVTLESAGGVAINRESPSVVTLTSETPLAIDTGGEPPTDPCA